MRRRYFLVFREDFRKIDNSVFVGERKFYIFFWVAVSGIIVRGIFKDTRRFKYFR